MDSSSVTHGKVHFGVIVTNLLIPINYYKKTCHYPKIVLFHLLTSVYEVWLMVFYISFFPFFFFQYMNVYKYILHLIL